MKKSIIIFSFLILLVGFYCLICAILIPVGYLFLKQGFGNWGDIFSLGQFLADLFLIPFAILAFYITLQELKKMQEHAELIIGWETSQGINTIYLDNHSPSANYYSPSIVISNKGTAPSIHYQITLEIPIEIGRTKMVNPIWKGARQGQHQKFIFTSESHLVSFPNAPFINLGKIEFIEVTSLPQELSIKYYIASDKDEFKNGALKIIFSKNQNPKTINK